MAKRESKDFSWSTFYAHRKAVRKIYPSIYKVQLRKKLFDVVMEELKGGELVLDVGASTKALGDRIKKTGKADVIYKTMDIDSATDHDYHSLEEIEEKFDVIILSEVIEHIEFNEGIEFLKSLKELLVPGGRLIVSTPNLNHPNRYFQDPDHKTPYTYETLGAALEESGLPLSVMYRIYNDSIIRRTLRLYITTWLYRYLDIDFAKSIVAVAVKG